MPQEGVRRVETKRWSRYVTHADLPDASRSLRWTSERKESVALAVEQGVITRTEAEKRYRITPEELDTWIRNLTNTLYAEKVRTHKVGALIASTERDALAERVEKKDVSVGPFTMNEMTRVVFCNGKRVLLNRRQYALLKILISVSPNFVPLKDLAIALDVEMTRSASPTVAKTVRVIRDKLLYLYPVCCIDAAYAKGARFTIPA